MGVFRRAGDKWYAPQGKFFIKFQLPACNPHARLFALSFYYEIPDLPLMQELPSFYTGRLKFSTLPKIANYVPLTNFLYYLLQRS
ncbi:hypothetical protein AWR27_03110 [Spirosoma montaniterrae]|uniref:Uncharacterized protein n=1 Tax=Spirosoma montaniterrae TaxID=1178516 RepID=A0A1P9WSV0_9BACT|nr:hypothetical protein AWR27_03110 [Spirosoma montaniterrae]